MTSFPLAKSSAPFRMRSTKGRPSQSSQASPSVLMASLAVLIAVLAPHCRLHLNTFCSLSPSNSQAAQSLGSHPEEARFRHLFLKISVENVPTSKSAIGRVGLYVSAIFSIS